MTNTTALLRAIEQNPDDDTLKLIYADALQEDDSDPANFYRADFIRKSIAHHDKGYEWSRFPKWYWIGFPVLPEQVDGEFSKGFCISIRLTLARFEEVAAELFTREPLIRGVEFGCISPWFDGVGDSIGRTRKGKGYSTADELSDSSGRGVQSYSNSMRYLDYQEALLAVSEAAIRVGKKWAKGVRK